MNQTIVNECLNVIIKDTEALATLIWKLPFPSNLFRNKLEALRTSLDIYAQAHVASKERDALQRMEDEMFKHESNNVTEIVPDTPDSCPADGISG